LFVGPGYRGGYSKPATQQRLQLRDKLFRSHSRLLQDPAQGANRKFRMQRNDTTTDSIWSNAFKDDVTSTLPNATEAQSFKSTDRFCP
jgi:hypothetical protein